VRCPARSLASIVVCATTWAACGAPVAPVGPRVDDGVIARRLALGPFDDVLVPRGDERQRLRALRDLAAELGNDGEASGAGWEVLELSRQRLAIATAEGGDTAAARRELEADAVALIDLSVLAGRPDNVRRIADVGVAVGPGFPRADAFLRAALAAGWLSRAQATAALALARDDRDRALLERAQADAGLDLARVVALGPDFVDRVEARLVAAVGRGDLPAAAAAARALVAVEPLHVEARLVLAYDRDRAAGRLVADADVVRSLLAAPAVGGQGLLLPGPRTVAIVEHARAAAPAATSLAIGSAWVLINAGLAGDAAARLDRAASPGAG
jgi:hypothetical protein